MFTLEIGNLRASDRGPDTRSVFVDGKLHKTCELWLIARSAPAVRTAVEAVADCPGALHDHVVELYNCVAASGLAGRGFYCFLRIACLRSRFLDEAVEVVDVHAEQPGRLGVAAATIRSAWAHPFR